MSGIPHNAIDRVRALAHRIGRTPTQKELRRIGIWTHQKPILEMAGLALRPKGGRVERLNQPEEPPVIPAVVQDAVGTRIARSRLTLYRVPPPKGDELNPLQTWMP